MLIKLVSVATVLSKVTRLVNARVGTPTRSSVPSPSVFILQSEERVTAPRGPDSTVETSGGERRNGPYGGLAGPTSPSCSGSAQLAGFV